MFLDWIKFNAFKYKRTVRKGVIVVSALGYLYPLNLYFCDGITDVSGLSNVHRLYTGFRPVLTSQIHIITTLPTEYKFL